MSLSRATLERQLELHKQSLATVSQELAEQGVAEADQPKSPKWRKAKAQIRKINGRLASVAALEEREAAAASKSEETDAD
jgi:hypothetical protein